MKIYFCYDDNIKQKVVYCFMTFVYTDYKKTINREKCLYFFLISANLCKKSKCKILITFEKYALVICTLYVKKMHTDMF